MLLTQTAEQGANDKRSNPSNKKQAAAPTQQLKLIDFGEANITINADRIEVGTPGYMAPEVMTDGDCTAASDIYSAGASLVELWSGGIWAGDGLAGGFPHSTGVHPRRTSRAPHRGPALRSW